MTVLSITRTVTTLLLLCLSSPHIVASYGEFVPPRTLKGRFAAVLQPFADKLSLLGALIPSGIHAATDLTNKDVDIHQALSNQFFVHGKEWHPQVIYLGRHPDVPETHMAASYFQPDRYLTNQLIRRRGVHKQRRGKIGALAINLRANEEPEFVGVMWFKSSTNAQRLKNRGLFIPLNEVEEMVPSLQDIQRVVHHRPVFRSDRTVEQSLNSR